MVCYIFISADLTHTNLYLANFIQITATSSRSYAQFHAYVHQVEPISRFMFNRTQVTMRFANQRGYRLKDALSMLDAYIGEQLENMCEPIRIVCHGGKDHLFLILALAIERTFGEDYLRDLTYLIRANYIDSAQLLSKAGCQKVNLGIVCRSLGIAVEKSPSAETNARAIKQICTIYHKLLEAHKTRVTIEDLMHTAGSRQPLSIANVAMLVKHMTLEEVVQELYKHCTEKSALKVSIVLRLANLYTTMHFLRLERKGMQTAFSHPLLKNG